jgi:hypothetical protein
MRRFLFIEPGPSVGPYNSCLVPLDVQGYPGEELIQVRTLEGKIDDKGKKICLPHAEYS